MHSAETANNTSGCDDRMFDQRKNRWVACRRHHIDFNDNSWSRMDKAAYAKLWAWLLLPGVEQFFIPADALRAKME